MSIYLNPRISNFKNIHDDVTLYKNLKPKKKWVEKYMNEDDDKNVKKKQIQREASARYRRRLAQELKLKVKELQEEETRNQELFLITKEALNLVNALKEYVSRNNIVLRNHC